MPPTIQILAEKLVTARGTEHWLQSQALKNYIEGLTDIDFSLEIDRVDNPNIFRYLFAAGLPMRRQSIISLKARELEK